MTKDEQFRKDVYGYTLDLIEEMDAKAVALCLARWMERQNLKTCLDANELSPRFLDWEEYDD